MLPGSEDLPGEKWGNTRASRRSPASRTVRDEFQKTDRIAKGESLRGTKDSQAVASRAAGPASKSIQIYCAVLSRAGGGGWSFLGFFSGKV
jgi:hypothetical protein